MCGRGIRLLTLLKIYMENFELLQHLKNFYFPSNLNAKPVEGARKNIIAGIRGYRPLNTNRYMEWEYMHILLNCGPQTRVRWIWPYIFSYLSNIWSLLAFWLHHRLVKKLITNKSSGKGTKTMTWDQNWMLESEIRVSYIRNILNLFLSKPL